MMVSVEVDSVHGEPSGQRLVFFRCTDSLGAVSEYGPVITTDPGFDPQACCAMLLAKLNQDLSE
jgi:hypothetical protein